MVNISPQFVLYQIMDLLLSGRGSFVRQNSDFSISFHYFKTPLQVKRDLDDNFKLLLIQILLQLLAIAIYLHPG